MVILSSITYNSNKINLFFYMKHLKYLFLIMMSVLAFSSCENEEEKEPKFDDYFKMHIERCEHVGDNVLLEFKLKNISGEDLQNVRLNGESVWDRSEDNTGETYYSEMSIGSNWKSAVEFSMNKGQSVVGKIVIRNFNKSIKANKLNLRFNCRCQELKFDGRGEVANIGVTDNRVNEGIRTNDLGLKYTIVSCNKKVVEGKNTVDLTFKVENTTGTNIEDFTLGVDGMDVIIEDNLGEKYYYTSISSDGEDFKSRIYGTLYANTSQEFVIRISNVQINAQSFSGTINSTSEYYPLADNKVRFYNIEAN